MAAKTKHQKDTIIIVYKHKIQTKEKRTRAPTKPG